MWGAGKQTGVVNKLDEKRAYRLSSELGVKPNMLHKPYVRRRYSWAKKIVSYYLGVELELSHQAVATWLGCERSTVSYNIRAIEDLRDDYAMDANLDHLFSLITGGRRPTTEEDISKALYVREFNLKSSQAGTE